MLLIQASTLQQKQQRSSREAGLLAKSTSSAMLPTDRVGAMAMAGGYFAGLDSYDVVGCTTRVVYCNYDKSPKE